MAEAVLVSGGSGGIGAATCDALAERGYRPLVGYASNRKAAEGVAARCAGLAVSLDMACEASIGDAVALVSRLEVPLAGVVLAASPAPEIQPFGKIDPVAMRSQWQVNVIGPQLLLTGLVKTCFRSRKGGIVLGVLTSAMADADKPAAGSMGAYVIAKYGMAGLLDVLAADYPWLTVRSVRPGFTETSMLKAFDERYLDMMRERAPFATPEAVAERIVQEMFAQ
jgi:3-oxoacyl-[acyl-carrier protein] reductase